MLHVWYSNRLDRLAERLVSHLNDARPAFPACAFEKTELVVPSRGLATYLRFEVARATGIAANLEFHFLDEFLAGLVPAARPDLRPLRRQTVQALLLGLFSEDDGLPEPVRAYLEAAPTPDARELRRFQLAAEVAGLFEHYRLGRPEMLAAWAEECGTIQDDRYAATESWQRALWWRLFGPGGRVRELQARSGLRLVPVTDLLEVVTADELTLPPQVHLFGFSYLTRAHLTLLRRLAQHTELHLYTLRAALEFREDLESVGESGGWDPRFPRRGTRVGPAALLNEADPFHLNDPDHVAAVQLWERPGREFLRLLHEDQGSVLHPEFEAPGAQAPTLLQRLQRDILLRAEPAGDGDRPRADGSLQVLACPGIQREVEVIANEIWSLLHEDDRRARKAGRERLRFNDIAVLLADTRQRELYQTHLRSAFAGLHDLPFTIIDLPAAGESPVLEALGMLLDLPLGGFTRPELLGLLTHPAVLARFPDAEPAAWQAWCEATAVFHGADRQDHAGLYIDKDLFHWDQGLRRLALGAFMTGERSGDGREFRLGAAAYLPEEYPADRLASAALLVLLVRSLVADARFAREARLTLTEWSAFLGRLATTYLGADSEEDERSLALCRAEIDALRDLDVDGRKVSYRTAAEFVRQALAGLGGSRGKYLAGGVAVSSFLPMRALPFRVVFVCGLGEGVFPAPEPANPLDLTRVCRRAGDVSPRERDRYLFLETLVSTRDRLYLSYIARDGQTGEEQSPSPLVQELLHLLGRHYLDAGDMNRLVKSHPLRRYDERYFPLPGPRKSGWPNHSPAARCEANAGLLRQSLQAHLGRPRCLAPDELRRLDGRLGDWLGLCPLPDAADPSETPTVAVSFAAVRRFLECPLQGWAGVQLGMREEETDDALAREDERFATPPLDTAVFLREVFLEALARVGPSEAPPFAEVYDARVAYLELKGVLPTGIFRQAERDQHLRLLRGWQANFRALGLERLGPFQVLRFGRAAEHLDVHVLRPPVLLEVELPRSAERAGKLRVELYGQTELVGSEASGSLSLVMRGKPSDKDYLRGFLDHVILTLTGQREAGPYRAFVLPGEAAAGRGGERRFAPLTRPAADRYLKNLLGEMLGRPHGYLLPCEAVFEHRAGARPVGQIIAGLKDRSLEGCSSRFGPVPHPERYDGPSESEALLLIERRFGPFFAPPEDADG